MNASTESGPGFTRRLVGGLLCVVLLCGFTVPAHVTQVYAGHVVYADHVPGAEAGWDTGARLGPRQLAWGALLIGGGLLAGGMLRGKADLAILGGLLAPAGGMALWRQRGDRDTTSGGLSRKYDLTHYGEDMRYLFEKHPNRDMIARSLIRRYPEVHREFLFSLTAFGSAGEDAAAEQAFAKWYQSLAAEMAR